MECSQPHDVTHDATNNGESRAALQQTVLGRLEYNGNQKPLLTSLSTFHLLGRLCAAVWVMHRLLFFGLGKFLAFGCEMMGEGAELSLARVNMELHGE
jgi:hypothetical protein